MRKQIILLHDRDNVVIAVDGLAEGAAVKLPKGQTVTTRDEIPASHKVAIRDIAAGEPVIRYGEEIGYATKDILAGQWVHLHNLDAINTMKNREGG
jgi:altronate hydrolase